LYFEGHQVARDERLALHWFSRAAQGGNAFAQAWFGDIFIRGQGVPVDRDAALLWYERAARQGHAGATLMLARLLLQHARDPASSNQAYDEARASDEARAAQLLQSAADAGHPAAMTALASLYESGRGVGVDLATALTLYRRALAAGDPEAEPALRRLEPAADA
jgi:TPR repeat protein